jgi:hypothetical protein
MNSTMQPQPITACDPRALANFKHGLAGRIFFFNEAEQSAYGNLYSSRKESPPKAHRRSSD